MIEVDDKVYNYIFPEECNVGTVVWRIEIGILRQKMEEI